MKPSLPRPSRIEFRLMNIKNTISFVSLFQALPRFCTGARIVPTAFSRFI